MDSAVRPGVCMGWSPTACRRRLGGRPLPAAPPRPGPLRIALRPSPHLRLAARRDRRSLSPCAELCWAGGDAGGSAMADRSPAGLAHTGAEPRRAGLKRTAPPPARPRPAAHLSRPAPLGPRASGVTPGRSPPTPLWAAARSGCLREGARRGLGPASANGRAARGGAT